MTTRHNAMEKQNPDKVCESQRCYGKVHPGQRYCSKCKMRRWREENEMLATYSHKRQNAASKGIAFSITFDEWVKWCTETNYLKLRGPNAEDMTVGRKNHFLGYTYDNIKLQTQSDNAREGKSGQRPKYVKADGDPF